MLGAFSFSSLGVRGRIIAGSLAGVGVVAVATGFGAWQLLSMPDTLDRFAHMAEEALVDSELNADMGKTLLFTREYIQSRAPAPLESARKYLREVKEGLVKAKSEAATPEAVSLIDRLDGEVEDFAKGIDSLVVLNDERNQIVDGVLDELGPKVREGLTTINESATHDGDHETANHAG